MKNIFTLKIFENKYNSTIPCNFIIGDKYEYIERGSNKEFFKYVYKEYFNKKHVADLDDNADYVSKNIGGFILTYDNENNYTYFPIFKDVRSYVLVNGIEVERFN